MVYIAYHAELILFDRGGVQSDGVAITFAHPMSCMCLPAFKPRKACSYEIVSVPWLNMFLDTVPNVSSVQRLRPCLESSTVSSMVFQDQSRESWWLGDVSWETDVRKKDDIDDFGWRQLYCLSPKNEYGFAVLILLVKQYAMTHWKKRVVPAGAMVKYSSVGVSKQ